MYEEFDKFNQGIERVGDMVPLKKNSFKLSVNLEMNTDLAIALGNFILDNNCQNPALLAIAHQILSN